MLRRVLAPTTPALLVGRPREHCGAGTAVRLRRRCVSLRPRPLFARGRAAHNAWWGSQLNLRFSTRRRNVQVAAVLSPDREETRTENGNGKGSGTVKKIFKFLRSLQDEEQEALAVYENGNGAGRADPVRDQPASPAHETEQKPFFHTWSERSPTEAEVQVLREKLSPQAGGWDNWGGEQPPAIRRGGEAVATGPLPSNEFLGIDEPERTRPEWFPQFFDPFDRASDMRRWIIPYVLVPYLVSQTVRVAFLMPLFERELEMRNPIFALKGEQEEKVEHEVGAFKNHLQFEQLLGRSPPLTDTEMQATLRKKALDLEREEREHNCAALANFVTDSTFAIILVANLLLQLDEAEKLRKTLSKEFFSLDSSRQAFILLLVSDILVGYHSAEGWSTGLEGIGHHYGLNERKDLIAIFVAVVPVAMDVLFKFWVFKYLRNYSPDTQVILEEIDRH